MSMTTLSHYDHGLYVVITEHSAYMVNLDDRWVKRTPVQDDAALLPADATKQPLKGILRCEVGFSAILWLAGEPRDMQQVTSPVVSIEVAA